MAAVAELLGFAKITVKSTDAAVTQAILSISV